MNSLADSRPPVSTFEQAIWWLVGHSQACADFISDHQTIDRMPLEAVLVCDMFWVTKEQLRAKLVRAFREVDVAPAPVRRFGRGR